MGSEEETKVREKPSSFINEMTHTIPTPTDIKAIMAPPKLPDVKMRMAIMATLDIKERRKISLRVVLTMYEPTKGLPP